MKNPEIDFLIKKKLEELFLICLDNTGVYREYTDEELMQAVFVMNEVLLSKTHKHHRDKCTQEQLKKLAEELGKSIHQTILLFTGINLHKIT